jgi:hypothetical protein
MENKKQTAVNKLHSRILFNIGLDDNDIKELGRLVSECMNYEKERIMEALNDGKAMALGTMENKSLEQYYKETYE